MIRWLLSDVRKLLRDRHGGAPEDPDHREILVGVSNSGHDHAIAFIDNDAIFAEAIERHVQCKRASDVLGFTYSAEAIARGLRALGGGSLDDARFLVRTTWVRDTPALLLVAGLLSKAPHEWLRRSGMQFMVGGHYAYQAVLDAAAPTHARDLIAALRGREPIETELPVVRPLRHHLAHAANAALTSPFDECLVLCLDGVADDGPSSAWYFDGRRFERHDRARSQGSLGELYARVTALCGFDPNLGEEWKVMGLAAHGSPRDDVYRFFRDRIHVDGLRVRFDFAVESRAWVDELARLVPPFRRPGDDDLSTCADLAHNFQRCFEDVVCELAGALHATGRSDRLAYAGGCALNSSANGKLLARTPFRALHVPSAPADDGSALGAVLYDHHITRGKPRLSQAGSPFLGSAPDLDELERILGFGAIPFERITDDAERARVLAELLARGSIVGLMQGRAELGPRALGNRSILADPRDPSMKDRINALVKFRESYRPLAPSILHEHGPDYFEGYAETPYMERALPFRSSVRARVPAVVHADGTGRLQSVTRERTPGLHAIISAFHERTSVPLVVNTSLNVMGKPIVHSARDALTVFVTTGLDALAIGPFLMRKPLRGVPPR